MKLLAIFLFTSVLIFSQGEYIDSGVGFEAGYRYLSSESFTGYGLNFGLSISGDVDVAIQHSSQTVEGLFNSDITTTSNALLLAYNLKYSQISTLKLKIGYLFSSVDFGADASGLLIGGTYILKVIDTKSFELMPALGFTYGSLNIEQRIGSRTVESSESVQSFNFDLNLALRVNEILKIILKPGVSKDIRNSSNPAVLDLGISILINPQLKDINNE